MWLKLSDDVHDDFDRDGISRSARLTHIEALGLVMKQLTGGRLLQRALRKHASGEDLDADAAELVSAGYWSEIPGGWLVRHHMEHQPEPDLVLKRRATTAERVRQHRRRKAKMDEPETPGNRVGNAVGNAVTERVTRVGSGRDGEDQNPETRTYKKGSLPAADRDGGWPEVAVPGRPPIIATSTPATRLTDRSETWGSTWCGECDEHRRVRYDADDREFPCACHVLAAVSA